MRRHPIAAFLLAAALVLASCSSSSSGGTGGGSLAFGQASYSATTGSAIDMTLTLSGSTDTSGVTVTIASDRTSVAVPATSSCTLSDQAGSTASCQVRVRGLVAGSATVSASAPGVAGASASLTVSASPVPGALAFTPTSETVVVQATQRVTLALMGSSGIPPTTVRVGSTALATVSPSACTLSTALPSCTVTVTGVGPGSATVTASASGYTSATSAVTVIPSSTIPGTLAFDANVQVPVGTHQTATLRLLHSSNVSAFGVALNPQNALATIAPTNCTLSSASPVCSILVTGVGVGSDPVVTTATGYSPATLMTTVTSGVLPGNLAFSVPSEIVVQGATTTVGLSLVGSQGVSGLPVTLTPSANVSISPTSCSLGSGSTCTITISGLTVGSATITAAATGYTSAVNAVTVQPSGRVVYGSLEFTAANVSLLPGSSGSLTLQLVDSSNVSSLAVRVSASPESLVTLSPSSCTLSTANSSCVVGITAGATAGTATVTSSAAGPAIQATASVTVDSSAAPSLSFGTPNPLVLPQSAIGSSTSVLTMTNAPATPVYVALSLAPSAPSYLMPPSPGFCNLSAASPSCIVNVNHANATDPAGGPYNVVAAPVGSGIQAATLPVYIAATNPVDRVLTVVNDCTFTVYPGISGGAVAGTVSTACPTGSTNVAGTCYWNNPAPTNAPSSTSYALATGQSMQFRIPGSYFAGGQYQWNGNVMARRDCDASGNCTIGTCNGGSTALTQACAAGTSFQTPQTMAEFTLLANGPDTFDVTVINGVTVPTMMTPNGLTRDPGNPYTNGVAGAPFAQPGTMGTLSPATWSFAPDASDTSISPVYYNLVTPVLSQSGATVPCSNLTCPAGQACGYPLSSITKPFSAPDVAYQLVCGTRLAYLTAEAVWKGNPETSVPATWPNVSNAAPFGFYSTPGTGAWPGYQLLDCPTPPMSSGYGSGPVASTCGCSNWTGITWPFIPCQTINPDWTGYTLPKITWLKMGCPTCYTYVYDDEASTFTGYVPAATNNAANDTGYTITFCPNGATVPAY